MSTDSHPTHTGGTKFDGAKSPIFRGFISRFPLAMSAVAQVSEYGYRKYGAWDGWQHVPDGIARYTDALHRHQGMEVFEGPYDVGDSGLAHAAQVAWNAMARLELMMLAGHVVETPGNQIVDGKPVIGSNGATNDVPLPADLAALFRSQPIEATAADIAVLRGLKDASREAGLERMQRGEYVAGDRIRLLKANTHHKKGTRLKVRGVRPEGRGPVEHVVVGQHNSIVAVKNVEPVEPAEHRRA